MALLQEATPPPPDIASVVEVDNAPWRTGMQGNGRQWRTSIARFSDRVNVEWMDLAPLGEASGDEVGVSMMGAVSIASIKSRDTGDAILGISAYGCWEQPHPPTQSRWIYADASVHRLISDLSALIGKQRHTNLLLAGDFNILHGHGENGSRYWAARYGTVFDRLRALGLIYAGPQHPDGRQADPWPSELPRDSRNVPTFRSNRKTPATASRQLDFVFASQPLIGRLSVKAINQPDFWDISDHCKIEITLGDLAKVIG